MSDATPSEEFMAKGTCPNDDCEFGIYASIEPPAINPKVCLGVCPGEVESKAINFEVSPEASDVTWQFYVNPSLGYPFKLDSDKEVKGSKAVAKVKLEMPDDCIELANPDESEWAQAYGTKVLADADASAGPLCYRFRLDATATIVQNGTSVIRNANVELTMQFHRLDAKCATKASDCKVIYEEANGN